MAIGRHLAKRYLLDRLVDGVEPPLGFVRASHGRDGYMYFLAKLCVCVVDSTAPSAHKIGAFSFAAFNLLLLEAKLI